MKERKKKGKERRNGKGKKGKSKMNIPKFTSTHPR